MIARAADFVGLEILYKKMSLEGSVRALNQKREIAIDLHPDLSQDKGNTCQKKLNAVNR